jgi:hypothetical protein
MPGRKKRGQGNIRECLNVCEKAGLSVALSPGSYRHLHSPFVWKRVISEFISRNMTGLPEVVGWRLHVINQQTKEVRRMNRHTIPLGRILGIPIGLDYSWCLIFVLITWTMAVGYYPAEFKNWFWRAVGGVSWSNGVMRLSGC